MPRKQFLLLFACAIVALLVGMLASRSLLRTDRSAPALTAGTLLTPARPLGDFRLIDQTNTPFTRARLERHWTLVFFGFTSCPDVCPTTLTFMSQLEKSLHDLDEKARPRTVFVSVDSERDTPEKIKTYVEFFNPSFMGLAGTRAEIDAITKMFGVPYSIARSADGSYTVDHSAAIFLVNPHAQLQALFTPPHDLKAVADDVRRVIAASET